MAEFIIQHQQESEWCWAAVAATIDQYFNPLSPLRQCDVATRVLGSDNCSNPINEPAILGDAVQVVNPQRVNLERALNFDELRREIDAGRPVCCAIEWTGGGGHAVVVTGYRVLTSGVRHIHVEDPLNASGDFDFDEFRNAYYGHGTWVETALISPPKGSV